MIDYALLAVWSVLLSFFVMEGMGNTHFISHVSPFNVAPTVDALFFLFVVLFAVVLWRLVPRPLSNRKRVLFSIPTFALLIVALH